MVGTSDLIGRPKTSAFYDAGRIIFVSECLGSEDNHKLIDPLTKAVDNERVKGNFPYIFTYVPPQLLFNSGYLMGKKINGKDILVLNMNKGALGKIRIGNKDEGCDVEMEVLSSDGFAYDVPVVELSGLIVRDGQTLETLEDGLYGDVNASIAYNYLFESKKMEGNPLTDLRRVLVCDRSMPEIFTKMPRDLLSVWYHRLGTHPRRFGEVECQEGLLAIIYEMDSKPLRIEPINPVRNF